MIQQFDIAVLGAGIVGVSTAIYLQRLGASVLLADRRGAGRETSFGNAGIIQREAIHPALMPRNLLQLARLALNLRPEVRFNWSCLPEAVPFLVRYWQSSSLRVARLITRALVPLLEQSLNCHQELAQASGCSGLISRNGYLRLFRRAENARGLRDQLPEFALYGLDAAFIEDRELGALEPHLDRSKLEAAVHFRDPWTVRNPGELVESHARQFEREGGRFAAGDAMSLHRKADHWSISTDIGECRVQRIVVALGPWSKNFLARFGFGLPAGVKRGYHLHYRAIGDAALNRPVADEDNGYALAPMTAGIRLTTGVEFAKLNARKSRIQLTRALPRAKELFPIGEPVEMEPWMGTRPVLPDMLPALGPLPGYPDIWLNVGHGHIGLTLGPATGKLLAQMMCGKTPFCDPQPYSAQRYSAGRQTTG